MRASKMFLPIIVLFAAPIVPSADAQVREAATGSAPHLWVGVEGSSFNPDYNKVAGRLDGVGFYGDYFFTRHVGLEGEIRLLDLNKPEGETEKTFLIGPTVNAYSYRNFTAYAKVLAGVGTINYANDIGYGSYFTVAIGGGVEYQIRPRVKIRGEYEYEAFPSAPGFPGQSSNGLTPSGLSGGVSYRFF